MSKGSGRRPCQVDAATEAANWQRTFGDKTKPAPVKGPESDKSQGASA
jgi:hypothetical protein